MNNNLKKYIIIIICILIIGLIVYGVFFAIKNHNRGDIKTVDNIKASYTINSDQLDSIKQPEVNEDVTLDSLPEAKNILQEIDVKTLKKLFKTSKKSILFLVKDDCQYCDAFLPIVNETLNDMNISAYKINVSEVTIAEYGELFNYINFEGTPTTYIIQNSKVLHTLTGGVDKDTLKSFIDYFYIRNN